MHTYDTFCIHAWEHLVHRSDGDLSLCCHFRSGVNIKDSSLIEFYNSNMIKNIRSKMLSGQKVEQCKPCYDSEKRFGQSDRLHSNKYFNTNYKSKVLEKLELLGKETVNLPSRIELHLSNLCNLKCLTCCAADSSMFLVEENKLRIFQKHELLYNAQDFLRDEDQTYSLLNQVDLDKIEILDLRGGESLLVKPIKPFLKNIPIENKKNIILRIQTNGTIFDNEWAHILSEFKKVEFLLSIDAFDKDNYYIRFPAEWADICQTINQIKNLSNAELHITTTVSNLNVLMLPKLFDFFISNNLDFGFSFVTTPPHHSVANLPKELILSALDNLQVYKDLFLDKKPYKEIVNLFQMLENSLHRDFNLDSWREFCEIINFRDKQRNQNIFAYLPEYKTYWYYAHT